MVVPCVLSGLPTLSPITLFIVCVFVSVVEFPSVGAMSCLWFVWLANYIMITLFIVGVFVSVVEFPDFGAMSCFVVCVAFLVQGVESPSYIFLYDTLT